MGPTCTSLLIKHSTFLLWQCSSVPRRISFAVMTLTVYLTATRGRISVITVLYLYVQPFVAASTALYLGIRVFLADPMTIAGH